jgi:hypothetical protein
MTDQIFNISKGAFAEMIRDTGTKTGVLLLKVVQADDALVDHNDIAALLAAANTEAVFTSYGRKIDVVETLTVDDTNNRVDVDIPDQTWSPAGNGANDTLVKLITFYNNGAGDANQIPMSHHDFAVTTDGSDLTAQINAAGIMRAS